MVFIPATPGSELKKRYQRVIEKSGIRVAVAEVPGTTLKQRLQTSEEGASGKMCRRDGVLYKI